MSKLWVARDGVFLPCFLISLNSSLLNEKYIPEQNLVQHTFCVISCNIVTARRTKYLDFAISGIKTLELIFKLVRETDHSLPPKLRASRFPLAFPSLQLALEGDSAPEHDAF